MVSSCYFLWVVSFSLNGEKLDLFALQSLSTFSQGDVPQGEQHMLHPVHVTGARGPSQPFNTKAVLLWHLPQALIVTPLPFRQAPAN